MAQIQELLGAEHVDGDREFQRLVEFYRGSGVEDDRDASCQSVLIGFRDAQLVFCHVSSHRDHLCELVRRVSS